MDIYAFQDENHISSPFLSSFLFSFTFRPTSIYSIWSFTNNAYKIIFML